MPNDRDRIELRIVPPWAGDDVVAEMDRLERRRRDGTASDEDLARLEELPAALSKSIDEATVVLALVTATRRGGLRRGRVLQETRDWLTAQGWADKPAAEIPADVVEAFIIMQQGASIAGAIDGPTCRNFAVPETAEAWLEVPDYLFAPALAVAWNLNPHWAPALPAETEDQKNAGAPGSESSSKS